MIIEEFIIASHNATTVDALFGLYQKAMRSLGFDRIIFSLMTDHKSINRQAGHGIISNYPDDWMKYYREKSFERLDPVRGGMFATSGPFVWGEMEKTQPLTKGQMLFMNEGREAGLYSGIGVPLRGTKGAIAGVGAASSSGQLDLDPVTLSKASLISTQFYTMFLKLEGEHVTPDTVRLSDRELEVLQWLAAGKTRGEVATILHISGSTVNIHVDNILKKFETSNILIAIFRAVSMYLIQL